MSARYPGIRESGKGTWEIKFEAGRDPITGKRRTRYVTFAGTKAEASAERDRLKTLSRKGDLVDPSKMTLAEFIVRWDRDWAAANTSPKTLERYRELLRHHVEPHLGAVAIQKLRPTHLQELYARLLREGRAPREGKPQVGLSARTVGHVHRVVHRVLGHAMLWDVVTKNVASPVKPPKVATEEVEILRADQVAAVLSKLRGRTLFMIVALALASGARRGELLALRWGDVDWKAGAIRVERSLEQTKLSGLRFKEPKTKHGRRTIDLPSPVITELRTHHDARNRQRLGIPGNTEVVPHQDMPAEALVFALPDGAPRSPNALTREWSRIRDEIGLPPVSFHALRHTNASRLIDAGLDVLTISRRLGHGSPTITLGVYGHLFSNKGSQAAQALASMFGGRTE
ncbi:MAG: site-specific integrase [Rhodospirillales bacterium]|nr:site-specific integrase [Rhodospirillales bacterium]